jgi:hypothetical protein
MPGAEGPWKKPDISVNTCPHCSSPIPEGVSRCPECGSEYWRPGLVPDADPQGRPEKPEEQEGCASMLMLPLLVSLGVTACLILAGFVLNALARFESQQFKLLWLAGSCAAGFFFYRLIRKRKHKTLHESEHENGVTKGGTAP